MALAKFFITAAALSAPLVAGHGYMLLPPTTFPKGGDMTSPAGTIDSSKFTPPSGMSFTSDPTSNTKAFTAWLKPAGYSSLKDLIVKTGGVGACGNSAVGTPQPLPAQVEWTHSSSEGFTPSHEGPCEVWCDNQMAFHDDNCAKNFPSAPAKLPYDKTKCTGAKQLTMYWLALHSPQWQIYIGCAALSGASSGGSDGGSSSMSASTTPTVTPSTPPSPSATPPTVTPYSTFSPSTGPSSPAPASGSDDCDQDLSEPDCDGDLPEPGCGDNLPESGSAETGGDAETPTSNIGFGTIHSAGGEDSPGQVSPSQYA